MIDEVSKVYIGAIQNAVSVQSQIEFSEGQEVPSDPQISFKGDIGGFLKIDTDTAQGYVGIAFPKQTFLSILSSMLGEEYTEIDPDLEETIIGFLEVAYGNSCPSLKQQNIDFKKGEMGIFKDYTFDKSKPRTINCKVAEYTSDKGKFTCGVFLKSK